MTKNDAIRILEQQKNNFLEEWVDFGGVTEAYNMAIQSLKEEAMLLTETEIDDHISEFKYHAVFWVEERNSKNLFPVTLKSSNPYRNDHNFYDLVSTSYFPRYLLGKRWRCWTKKPTEEQRESAKWEGD